MTFWGGGFINPVLVLLYLLYNFKYLLKKFFKNNKKLNIDIIYKYIFSYIYISNCLSRGEIPKNLEISLGEGNRGDAVFSLCLG